MPNFIDKFQWNSAFFVCKVLQSALQVLAQVLAGRFLVILRVMLSKFRSYCLSTFMILQLLRDATHAQHQHLENRIDLLGRDWSLEFYRALLEKFYGFYAPLEPAIFTHPQWHEFNFVAESRRKICWLQNDLQFLGLSAAQIEALPLCKYLPRADTFARAVGCAYVVEGSTLGGQIISRHLKTKLNLPPRGCRFFTAYGEQTGKMWREFVALLNDYEAPADEQNELLLNAGATFGALDCWLDEII